MMTDSAERKPTVRRRRRAGQGGKGGMSRILWLVALLCVAGAVALFRTSGGGKMPVGLGEKRTVVTAPEAGDAPRSGEVDIASQGMKLTPEKQVPGSDLGHADNAPLEVDARLPLNETGTPDQTVPPATTGGTKPATGEPAPAPVSNPDPIKPDPTPAPAAKPAALAPQAQGPFLVQAASLGDQDKAQAEADRLQKFGWEAAVRGAGKAGGGMTFRVQIGYFATREDAQAFIDQNKAKLPGAIPAHR
jgi:cell division septation protein DedD